jgi:hypothetical protein
MLPRLERRHSDKEEVNISQTSHRLLGHPGPGAQDWTSARP